MIVLKLSGSVMVYLSIRLNPLIYSVALMFAKVCYLNRDLSFERKGVDLIKHVPMYRVPGLVLHHTPVT